MFLVIWNMISQSAVFFSWKLLADDFWLCIFASRCSRNCYLPGQPVLAPFPNTPKCFSSPPPILAISHCARSVPEKRHCRAGRQPQPRRRSGFPRWGPPGMLVAADVPPELGHYCRGGDGEGYVSGGRSWPEGEGARAWRDVFSPSWRAAGWRGRAALGRAGTQWLRNWSPRFVYPLYISQTWKLKKVKFMRKI